MINFCSRSDFSFCRSSWPGGQGAGEGGEGEEAEGDAGGGPEEEAGGAEAACELEKYQLRMIVAMIVSTPGPERPAVPRAAGPGEEATHWAAPDEGHGPEATGGGEEEGDREIWAWKKRGDHCQEQRERPATRQSEEEQQEQHGICIWKLRAQNDGAQSW